jgi:hypothetical protein
VWKRSNYKVITLLCVLTFPLLSQKGAIFPGIAGQTLDQKPVKLPVINGKYSVIGLAYSRKAEKDLKEWLNPIYSLFVKSGDGGALDFAEIYDVNFHFIPVIPGFRRVAAEFRKGTDRDFWPYIVDAEDDDIRRLESALKPSSTGEPYFFVLDKDGRIVETQHGSYSDAKLEKLEDAVQ